MAEDLAGTRNDLSTMNEPNYLKDNSLLLTYTVSYTQSIPSEFLAVNN